MSLLAHPEWVDGKRLWLDPQVEDMIDRIQNGDPVLGWDGDERLAVYCTDTPEGMVWELYRLEHDEEYRFVVRTEAGIPFDQRIIHWLIANDKHRKPAGWSLADEVEAKNAKVDADRAKASQERLDEDVLPRLRWAMKKDGV